jgi:hypothetical protein
VRAGGGELLAHDGGWAGAGPLTMLALLRALAVATAKL